MLLAAALTALVLWAVHNHWYRGRFQWGKFAESFLEIEWKWVVASSALALASYYVRALRWSVMLKPLQPTSNAWRLFKATAIGFTVVVLLGRPGEFVRPYLIALKERVPLSSQFASWLLERILDLLAVLVIFSYAASRIGHSHANLGPPFRWSLEAGGWAAALLGLVCLALLVMFGRFSGTARRRLLDALSFLPSRYHKRTERIVTAFLEGTAATKQPGSASRLIAYTLLEWVTIVLCILCLFRAFDETSALGVQDALLFLGLVSFGSILQIPGVGGGMQLLAIIVLTQLYGVRLEAATSIAIMFWIVTFVVIMPPGLLFACQEGFNWRKLRDLERRAVRAEAAEPVPEAAL
ncbi:MAG: lysylphosphatidylglycerol synthase transmembrane domain-containing protein [Bryobacteraceae bacterium]